MAKTSIVLRSAIASRLLLISLIILWRWILRPYDTSASINPSCLSPSPSHTQTLALLPRVGAAIEESIVWDSVYMVRIAECGYEYEQYFAFFPLLPLCISLLSRTVFAPLVPLIGYRAVLGLSGYVINSISFVLSAMYLYRLSIIILKDENRAVRAAILFCFNPASVFYSSIYTESLYSLFSIGGLYYMVSGANSIATVFFALSGAARSNGMINAGYICYWTMHKAFDAIFCKRSFLILMQVVTRGAFSCLCTFIPFIAFQAYGYNNICLGQDSNELSPWCNARLPLLYNYVQSHYWGVGFLRYFEIKQLPNFLLASPILSLALGAIIYYVKLSPTSFFSLGFRGSSEDEISAPMPFLSSKWDNIGKEPSFTTHQGDHSLRQRKQTIKEKEPVILPAGDKPSHNLQPSTCIVPIVLHLAFLTATAFFVMYVQVATRFLSASPPLYWFASYVMVSPGIGKRLDYLIWTYSAAYILLGSLLFSNFYPFT